MSAARVVDAAAVRAAYSGGRHCLTPQRAFLRCAAPVATRILIPRFATVSARAKRLPQTPFHTL